MPIRLGRFEMPSRLTKDEAASKGNYAKFVAEPFEAGYGHTLGNSLRRVLLSLWKAPPSRASSSKGPCMSSARCRTWWRMSPTSS